MTSSPNADAIGIDAGAGKGSEPSRRWLLRSGLLAAGAAGVAAATTLPAQAADGDAVVIGQSNTGDATTTLTIGDGAEPTLALENGDGPSLYLQPLVADFAPELALGEIANTSLGPILGVDTTVGQATTFLATGIDLADLPTPYALPKPIRVLDTRTATGRSRIVRTSPNPFDSRFRLVPGAWLDVEIALQEADAEIPAANLNLTVTGSDAAGYASVYPPGDFPGTSTLNWAARQTIANHAFIATGIVLGRFAVRVRTNAATHVVLDLTGVTIKGGAPTPGVNQKSSTRSSRQRGALRARLRSSLADRLRSRLSG
jgi:hypothetical protein